MGHAYNFVDLTGQKFNKRLVLSWAGAPVYHGKKGSSLWNVVCECGRLAVVPTSNLKRYTSCGCDKTGAVRSGATRRSSLPLNARRNASHLRTCFKMTVEEFERKRAGQNNRCGICDEEFTVTPSVDHDHECCLGNRSCGKCVRGLLCKKCNAGIGCLRDSVDMLQKAINYLKGFKK